MTLRGEPVTLTMTAHGVTDAVSLLVLDSVRRSVQSADAARPGAGTLMSELPLAEASRRLRRSPGRPRRLTAGAPLGEDIQRAPAETASEAAKGRDFAATLLPRGMPLAIAAAYSGVPIRRLWAYIATGRLRPVRPPGCRRVLLDRFDLDRLLDEWKEPAASMTGAGSDQARGRP